MARKKAEGNAVVKPKGLFDHINHIRSVQDPKYFDSLSDADQKSWSNYMVCRFLSMQPEILEYVNEIQRYSDLPPRHFYQLCLLIVPRGRAFYPYIKGTKEGKWEKELILILRRHFEESERNILEYLEIIPKKELKAIVSMYGHTEKEVEKLISC